MPQAIATAFVTTAFSYLVSQWTKAETKETTATTAVPTQDVSVEPNQERTVAVRQPLPPRQFVYGACRIGGAVFYQDNDNPYLYIGCALSDGPIDAITAVYYGNDPIVMAAESPSGQAAAATGTIYATYFNLSYRLGTATQTADPLLSAAPNAPANFWQRGVACAAVRMGWGADAAGHQLLWGSSISPSFQGRFRKVYDPRNGSHSLSDSTTWTYSANPALCVADALTRAWGVALSTDYVDWSSVTTAANYCDTTLTYNGNSVPLFALAGVFKSDTNLADQIQNMLASFGGVITFSDGKYSIRADAPRTSVWTITDDDIYEIQEYVHGASITAAYSAIKASYFDKDDAGRQASTPVYEDSAAVAADGLRETSIDLPFCPADHSAQILAYRKLKELRNGRRLTMRVSDAAMALDAFDVVSTQSASAPMFDGTWQVDQIDMAEIGFILQLREYVSAKYTDPTTYLTGSGNSFPDDQGEGE